VPPGGRAGDGDDALVTPVYDHARLAGVGDKRMIFGPKSYRFTTSGYDVPILTVGSALKLTEQGRVQRKVLRSLYYPVQQKLPRATGAVHQLEGQAVLGQPAGHRAGVAAPRRHREQLWVRERLGVPVPTAARPCWPDRGLLRGAGPVQVR